jgi:hypothetical protein
MSPESSKVPLVGRLKRNPAEPHNYVYINEPGVVRSSPVSM